MLAGKTAAHLAASKVVATVDWTAANSVELSAVVMVASSVEHLVAATAVMLVAYLVSH